MRTIHIIKRKAKFGCRWMLVNQTKRPDKKTAGVQKNRMIFNTYFDHYRGDRDTFPPPKINSPVAV